MAETAVSKTDSLADVLAVERELAELVGTERQKAERWLDERKHELERDAQTELARLAQTTREDEEAARKSAAEKAAIIVERAASLAARIEALDRPCLAPVVQKHLACIVPGANR